MSKDFYTAGELEVKRVSKSWKFCFRQADSSILTLSGFQFTADASDSVLVAGEAGTCSQKYINDFRYELDCNHSKNHHYGVGPMCCPLIHLEEVRINGSEN